MLVVFRRQWLAVPALGLILAGCSGAKADDSVAPVLAGTYDRTSSGSIESITFYDDVHYVLWRTPCADESGSACIEDGTFALNPAATELSLTNTQTSATTVLPFHVLSTTSAGKDVSERATHLTLESLSIEGVGLSVSDAGALSSDAATLSNEAGPLTQVQSATVNGEGITQAPAAPAPPTVVSTSPCVFTEAITASPAATLASVEQVVQSKGGTLTGNTQAGSFSVSGVTGTYTVSGTTLTVTITGMPWYASCSAVVSAMSSS